MMQHWEWYIDAFGAAAGAAAGRQLSSSWGDTSAEAKQQYVSGHSCIVTVLVSTAVASQMT